MADDEPATVTPEQRKLRKKKARVRSAWISFGGRIVAQIVGAIASVVLGIIVVTKYKGVEKVPAAKETVKVEQASHPAHPRASRATGQVVIAVLPLQNYSADVTQAYFADGVTEAVITELAQIKGLRVTSRTSSMAYKGTTKLLTEISQELGVDLVLEGSVVRDDRRVRVTAQLIDAATDQHIWARSYDRAVGDLLSLQAEIAGAIAQAVNVEVAPRRLDAAVRGRPSLTRPAGRCHNGSSPRPSLSSICAHADWRRWSPRSCRRSLSGVAARALLRRRRLQAGARTLLPPP